MALIYSTGGPTVAGGCDPPGHGGQHRCLSARYKLKAATGSVLLLPEVLGQPLRDGAVGPVPAIDPSLSRH